VLVQSHLVTVQSSLSCRHTSCRGLGSENIFCNPALSVLCPCSSPSGHYCLCPVLAPSSPRRLSRHLSAPASAPSVCCRPKFADPLRRRLTQERHLQLGRWVHPLHRVVQGTSVCESRSREAHIKRGGERRIGHIGRRWDAGGVRSHGGHVPGWPPLPARHRSGRWSRSRHRHADGGLLQLARRRPHHQFGFWCELHVHFEVTLWFVKCKPDYPNFGFWCESSVCKKKVLSLGTWSLTMVVIGCLFVEHRKNLFLQEKGRNERSRRGLWWTGRKKIRRAESRSHGADDGFDAAAGGCRHGAWRRRSTHCSPSSPTSPSTSSPRSISCSRYPSFVVPIQAFYVLWFG
jgi:hypothetical protein